MGKTKGHVIDQTLEVWQPRTSQILTREDAREIVENVTGYFRILQEWEAGDCYVATKKADLGKQ